MAKIVAQTLNIFEGSLPETAADIATKFNIPQRDVLHLLRIRCGAARVRAATDLREKAAAIQGTIEIEIETPDGIDVAGAENAVEPKLGEKK